MFRRMLAGLGACTLVLLGALTSSSQAPETAAAWKMAEAPLMTPWAKDVGPDNALPEYPRPQMQREQWVNLNGLWDYAIVPFALLPDASARKNQGGVVGAPEWSSTGGPGGVGTLKFDGLRDAASVPRVIEDDFTIAFWVKTTQVGGKGGWFQGAGLVDGECPGVTNDFGTSLVGDFAAFGVGKPDTTITSKTPINDDRWHHVAAVRARETGIMQIYVDGKLEASLTGGKEALTVPTQIAFGQLQTGINHFRGSLADVRLYQRALEGGDIEKLAGNPGTQAVQEGLAGWWRFDADWKQQPKEIVYEGKILVPFPLESALSGVKRALQPWQLLYYHRKFKAPERGDAKRVMLHFGAVDWEAKVFVNGKLVGEHRGGYDAFSFDITEAIHDGDNDIIVIVFDPTSGTRGKQNLASMFNPGGIMYTPCSGIWQTVWLEAVPARRIEDLEITPDVDAGILRLKVHVAGKGGALEVEAIALDGDKEVARAGGKPGAELRLPIRNARVWSPDDPFLYNLKITCGKDQVRSYFGMRKIALGKDEKGITRILLNNKFVFQVGVLDQGYWPDGIYTAPTDAALRFDVEMMRKLGLNMARKHVKVEPQRWYYWCDKLGLLVWQDMPSGDISKDNSAKKDGTPLSTEVGKQFETELNAMIAQQRNHPSIIMWVVFNEAWGQHDTERLTRWVKDLDPSRLVSNASGWHDRRCGDIIDLHKYPGPGSPKPEPNRAAVLGEFGGLGLAIEGHVWTKSHWGYKGVASSEALTRAYVDLFGKVWQLKDDPGLSAVVYTQWTDVETECNGLLTYDRKVVKVDARQVTDAHRGKLPPP